MAAIVGLLCTYLGCLRDQSILYRLLLSSLQAVIGFNAFVRHKIELELSFINDRCFLSLCDIHGELVELL